MTPTLQTRLTAGLTLAALACAAAGCSGATTAASPSTAAKTLQVTVTGKHVSPAPGDFDLKAGQILRLTVTSDHNDELHVHGFDKEVALTAGKPTTLDLVTSQPGAYVVETHHPELRLLSILVH
jgi:plastocyanin